MTTYYESRCDGGDNCADCASSGNGRPHPTETIGSTEEWAPRTDEPAQEPPNDQHAPWQLRRAKPADVEALMNADGWTCDADGRYGKTQLGATEMLRPPIGSMSRRTTRDANTGALMEDLWVDSLTADKQIRRALKAPTDLEGMVEMNSIDEPTTEEVEMAAMEPKEASLFRAIVARVNPGTRPGGLAVCE